MILQAADLASRIDGYLVLDVRPADRYGAGHVPTAINLDIRPSFQISDSSPVGVAAFREHHQTMFGAAGIQRTDRIVVYDDKSGAFAARAFWLFELFEQAEVLLLDGGFGGWQASQPVGTAPRVLPPSQYQPGWRADVVATIDETRDAIDAASMAILDTRTDDEFDGRDRRRAAHAGSIPGACHLEYLNTLAPDGRYLPAADLRRAYADLGIDPASTVIAYCEGGGRSAHAYLALKLAGYPHVKNYYGSWQEWGNRDDTPKRVTGAE